MKDLREQARVTALQTARLLELQANNQVLTRHYTKLGYHLHKFMEKYGYDARRDPTTPQDPASGGTGSAG